MPHIESELQDLRGSTSFASIDFCSGYWQLPLHEDSQPSYAFMAPNGVVQPTRTTQGGCNSAANFQEKVEPCFKDIRDKLKAWLDDFLIHSKDIKEHLQTLRKFFQICRNNNLFVSLLKSCFYGPNAKWCGRICDADGVELDPKNLNGIANASPPITANELC